MRCDPTPPHIAISPAVAGGQRHIEGRRIKVRDVAFQHEDVVRSPDETAAELDLDLAQAYAALAYCLDHRAEIERVNADRDAFVAETEQCTPSLLAKQRAAGADG